MKSAKYTIGIFGIGGFGREVYWSLSEMERHNTVFFVEDEYWEDRFNDSRISPYSVKRLTLLRWQPELFKVLIAIADPLVRKRVVESLPEEVQYHTFIHPTAQILDPRCSIGEGSIICPGTIITTNVQIGKHAHLNLNTTIGHDNEIGDYFTTAPCVQISGNCRIGDCVYFGSHSSIRQKLSVCDNVTVGLQSGVVKNITEPGIYAGLPAKLIK